MDLTAGIDCGGFCAEAEAIGTHLHASICSRAHARTDARTHSSRRLTDTTSPSFGGAPGNTSLSSSDESGTKLCVGRGTLSFFFCDSLDRQQRLDRTGRPQQQAADGAFGGWTTPPATGPTPTVARIVIVVISSRPLLLVSTTFGFMSATANIRSSTAATNSINDVSQLRGRGWRGAL